jgi:phosphatidylinositol kinase/protein kinase (PI-3  family)
LIAGSKKSKDEDGKGEERISRYMIKSGDDLRQDALILQLMGLFERVWRERLPLRWSLVAGKRDFTVNPPGLYCLLSKSA